jgi:hypothetical protein
MTDHGGPYGCAISRVLSHRDSEDISSLKGLAAKFGIHFWYKPNSPQGRSAIGRLTWI